MQQVPHSAVRFKRAERGVLAFPILVVGTGEIGAGPSRGVLCHIEQPVGLGIGQRLKQRRIDKAEDGHAHAHAERQDEHSCNCKAGAMAKLAHGEAQILRYRFKSEANRFVALLFDASGVAEAAFGGVACFIARHTVLNQLHFHLRSVEGHLFIELGAEPAAAEQERELSPQST